MKRILATLPFSSAACFAADDSIPPEIAAARARYDAAVSAATKPLKKQYAAELEQIKSRALTAKNAKLAVAVDEELQSVASGLKEALTDSTWLWWKTETITFLPNGKARWSVNGKDGFTWKVSNEAQRQIEGQTSKHEKYIITFDAGLMAGTLIQGGGSRPVRRVDAK